MATNSEIQSGSENETQSGPKIAAPEVSMPKGGGAIQGLGETFQPNAFSGTGDFSIPIPASPSRGLEPQLSLGYSSGSGNGPFGLGFSLSIPNVSYKTDKGIPKYDHSDVFLMSGAEELVPTPAPGKTITELGRRWDINAFRPRTEGVFARIERWMDRESGESHWRVLTADNIQNVYGRTEQARIADPKDPIRVFKWLLEETLDCKGNKVCYSYKQEDDANLNDGIDEANRNGANRYLEQLRYGNYFDTKGDEQFAFEVVFDYGEYDLNDPDAPPGTWKSRDDPFSSYRAGFEIRTQRLCRNVLLFHRFEHLFDNQRFLVRALHLHYRSTPTLTLLSEVASTGYRKQSNGGYACKSTPPLTLDYTPFEPQGRKFETLTVEDRDDLPGYLAPDELMLADLYGDGLPGVLQGDGTTLLYWQPEGDGHYTAPSPPLEFPIERDLQNPQVSLMDVDGGGALDLVVSNPRQGGFYANHLAKNNI